VKQSPVASSVVGQGDQGSGRWPAERWVWAGAAALVLFFLFFRLGDIPSGLFVDETSVGFNARAIGRTLADQYGVTLPLFFRALDDYRSPLYVYTAALTEALLGPSPLSVRLVPALYAVGTALLLYSLLRTLTGKSALARWIALLSLLTPSLFFYARVCFEASCIPFWIVLALLLLLRFERRPTWQAAAWAGFGMGFVTYSYATGRLLAPLMVATAAAFAYRDPAMRRHLPVLLGAAALTAIPMGAFVLAHPRRLETRFELISVWNDHPTAWVAAKRIAGTYLQHLFSPDFLFRSGQPNLWHNSGTGVLPLWLLVPMVFGLVALWRRRQSPFACFLGVLLLLSPIPVALTFENLPNTSRFLHFVPLALILGALAISDWIDAARPSRSLLALGCAWALFEGGLYLYAYFAIYPHAIEDSHEALYPLSGMDRDVGRALQVAFKARSGETPLFVPGEFLIFDGTFLDFYGDLDPIRLRHVGYEAMGIHPLQGAHYASGTLFILPGSGPPGQPAQLVGTSGNRLRPGPPYWSVYRAD
jgi:4-amino-4-deoxy-L-arabinose transferase-like glycosyltransferase